MLSLGYLIADSSHYISTACKPNLQAVSLKLFEWEGASFNQDIHHAHYNMGELIVLYHNIIVLPAALSGVIVNISFGGASSTQPTHLNNVQCTGTERNLLNCSHTSNKCGDTHGEDVGIICQRSQGMMMTFDI